MADGRRFYDCTDEEFKRQLDEYFSKPSQVDLELRNGPIEFDPAYEPDGYGPLIDSGEPWIKPVEYVDGTYQTVAGS